MYQIDNSTAASVQPTPAGAGTPGYFTNGVAGSVAGTVVDADWLNCVQNELMSILSAAGLTQSKTNYTQVLQALKSVPGIAFRNRQVFSASGSFVVPAGVSLLDVEIWGGGGGTPGSTSGTTAICGAGAGGYARKLCAVTPGQVIAVTVGAGGSAAAPGGTAGVGGTTSFGTFCTATGGLNGQPNLIGTPGSATGGDENITGGYGFAISASGYGGQGGASPRGGAGGGTGQTPGNAGVVPGGGAGGPGWNGTYSGSPGAAGRVTVIW